MMKNHKTGINKIPALWVGAAVLTVLAVIHLLDARAGAAESGDLWLTGRYLAAALAAVITAVIGGELLLGRRMAGRMRLEVSI